jgi:trehalose-6-phosphate synthase
VAEAIEYALNMPQGERIARWQSMMSTLGEHDVSWWAAGFLKDLSASEA